MRYGLAILSAAGLLLGCRGGTDFDGKIRGEAAVLTTSAPEVFPLPDETLEACRGRHKPLRIAFVIDNSGSNSATPGEPQAGNVMRGTDPIRQDSQHRLYTARQRAVFQTIIHLAQLDQKLQSESPVAVGSQIGLAYFPSSRSAASSGNFTVVSGKGPLPEVMTETSKVALTPDGMQQVWDMLTFTHDPAGMTPYLSAMEAAKKLLDSNRKAEDTRPDVVMLVTDGLPSDPELEPVRTLRSSFAGARIVLLSMYQPGFSTEEQNAPAKNGLKIAWDTQNWGTKEFDSFETYWAALLRLPGQLIGNAENEIRVYGAEQLVKKMDTKLFEVLSCGQPD